MAKNDDNKPGLPVTRMKVNTLVDKAAEAKDSNDAMRFSQAAVNCANALRVTLDMETQTGAK